MPDARICSRQFGGGSDAACGGVQAGRTGRCLAILTSMAFLPCPTFASTTYLAQGLNLVHTTMQVAVTVVQEHQQCRWQHMRQLVI